MPVGAGMFARLDHLVGRHQGARGGVVIITDRIEGEQVAPFGQFSADPLPRAVHGKPRIGVAPVSGLERRAGFGP